MELARLNRHAQLYPHQWLVCGEGRQLNLTVEDAVLGTMPRHEEELYFDDVWYGQLDHAERLKRVFLILAGGALHGSLELALHQVDHYRLIPLEVQLPESV